MKITHQTAIAEVIHAILNLPPHLKEAFSKGNPFDKLLRSYSEFTSTGERLYKAKRSFKHYPFSVKASHQFKKTGSLVGLHAEHVTPLSLIKKRLNSGSIKSEIGVKRFLAKHNQVVVITKEEQRKIDSKFRSKMPPNVKSRLEYFGIKIAKSTEKNTLNSK
jgi:hypothetical protein